MHICGNRCRWPQTLWDFFYTTTGQIWSEKKKKLIALLSYMLQEYFKIVKIAYAHGGSNCAQSVYLNRSTNLSSII